MDSDFGLGGSVFTRDAARGKRVASQIDTGMMFINNISWSDAELPFGEWRISATGANSATWASSSSSTRSWFHRRARSAFIGTPPDLPLGPMRPRGVLLFGGALSAAASLCAGHPIEERPSSIGAAMYVNVAVLKETQKHERRVALTPSVAPKLIKLGARLHMQTGAADAIRLGEAAFQDVAFIPDRKSWSPTPMWCSRFSRRRSTWSPP